MTLPGAGLWMFCRTVSEIAVLLTSAHSISFGHRTLPAFLPAGEPSRVVLLLSDDDRAAIDLAADLRRAGAATVVVDVPWYLADAARGNRRCALADVDFEALAKASEKALALPTYTPAELVGVGPGGAALAYVALAQAPAGTFAGAVSLGFCPELRGPAPFCHERGIAGALGVPRAEDPPPADGVLALAPAAALRDRWVAIGSGSCGSDAVRAFVGRIASARYAPTAEAADASAEIAAALAANGGAVARSAAAASLSDLPLREVRAPAVSGAAAAPSPGATALTSDALVVMVSGDGGWTGFDRDLGNALGRRGVPVVGLDSLRYFWTARTPDEVSRDLERVLDAYLAAWGKRRAILVGYSQGADVMPFMAAGLPPALRDRVALVTLIGPDPHADFAVDLEGWVAGAAPPPERLVGPEVGRLGALPVLCIYGAHEAHSLCPSLDPRRVQRLRLPATGHFYGDHSAEIVDSILAAANGDFPPAGVGARARHRSPERASRSAHAG